MKIKYRSLSNPINSNPPPMRLARVVLLALLFVAVRSFLTHAPLLPTDKRSAQMLVPFQLVSAWETGADDDNDDDARNALAIAQPELSERRKLMVTFGDSPESQYIGEGGFSCLRLQLCPFFLYYLFF